MIAGLGLSLIVLVGLSRTEAASVKNLIPDRGMHSTVPAGKWEEARRGQIRVDNLHWDLKKKEVRVTLTSNTDQEISLMLRRGIEEIVTDTGMKVPLDDGISAKFKLSKRVPVTLVITLM